VLREVLNDVKEIAVQGAEIAGGKFFSNGAVQALGSVSFHGGFEHCITAACKSFF